MPTEIVSKSPLSSKLNYVGMILVVWPDIEPVLRDLLPDSMEGRVMRVIGLGIIILRTFFTSQPIKVWPR